jgi:DMSO/TMAO reductase YedYZ molybdopterin-dependent catalytic subunit
MTGLSERARVALCLTAIALTTAATVQASSATLRQPILVIDGIVPTPTKLTAEDLAKLPRRTVQTKAGDGSVVTYEGPELAEVLRLAGVKFGADLKGPALAYYLLVTGADDFRVVFALTELDSSFTDRVIILADKKNGQALSAEEGPLRTIAPDEKRQGRWVKQVVRFTLMSPAAPADKRAKGRPPRKRRRQAGCLRRQARERRPHRRPHRTSPQPTT